MKKTYVYIIVLFVVASVFPHSVYAYGESPRIDTSPKVWVCTGIQPKKPWIYYSTEYGPNQAKLVWDESDLATSWTVSYGIEPGRYLWGLTHFGYSGSRSIVINHLPPGTYYFVVRANNGCMPGAFSNEVKVTVKQTSYSETEYRQYNELSLTESTTQKLARITQDAIYEADYEDTLEPVVETIPRESASQASGFSGPTGAIIAFFQGIFKSVFN